MLIFHAFIITSRPAAWQQTLIAAAEKNLVMIGLEFDDEAHYYACYAKNDAALPARAGRWFFRCQNGSTNVFIRSTFRSSLATS